MIKFVLLTFIAFINLDFTYSCKDICKIYDDKFTQDRCIKGCTYFRLIDAIQSSQIYELKMVECRMACEEAYLDKPALCHVGCQQSSNILIVGSDAIDGGWNEAPLRLLPVSNIVQPKLDMEVKKQSKDVSMYTVFDCRFLFLAALLASFACLVLGRSFKPKTIGEQKLSIYGDADELKLMSKINDNHLSKQVIIESYTSKQDLVKEKLPLTNPPPYLPIQMQIQNL